VSTPLTLAFVAPWENSRAVANIPKAPRDDVVVLLIESVEKGSALPWHRQKLVLVLSALRHFAQALRDAGYRVEHRLAPSYREGILAAARDLGATRVVATEPREWSLKDEFDQLAPALQAANITFTLRPDRGFVVPLARFETWAQGRKELRMEWFYRELRRETGLLMTADGKPEGGDWNFDHDNRKPWPKQRPAPPRMRIEPDALTRDTMAQVARWRDRWGTVDDFSLPVTRDGAKALLEQFVTERLPEFGPYEDAMLAGEPDLLHSCLSSVINVGLLSPLEVLRRAEQAYRDGTAPIASVEGFVRQILGWREYVRGVYWRLMPGLRTANALGAPLDLPQWFWEPDTCEMRCLADTIRQVRDHGRTHHINRLMVQSNIATLLGVRPESLSRWFWAAFTDAYEWVELPNVSGMGTWGDGGVMASKPYVSSGAYINRMSNYCKGCRYDVNERIGDNACPVNYLYWDFIARHRERFAKHPRMAQMIRTLDKFSPDDVAAMRAQADALRASVPLEAAPYAPVAPRIA
jgi:deoxyribodipyrimidine photolyase-related protein